MCQDLAQATAIRPVCPNGVSGHPNSSQLVGGWSQACVTPGSSCLPGHTFAASKDQLGFPALCLCYKKYVNIYLLKGWIGPGSTQGCSDSSVHMISFNLYLHRAPQLRLGVGFGPLSPVVLTVPSLWIHKPWIASGAVHFTCFVGKITGECITGPHRRERKDTQNLIVPLNTSPGVLTARVAAAHLGRSV